MEELIARVFAARDVAHKEHWHTGNDAAHRALGEFYDSVIPAIDSAVEAFQAVFGKLPKVESAPADDVEDLVEYLRAEFEWIEAHREMIAGGVNAIANLVDGISAVYLRAVYKLENLK